MLALVFLYSASGCAKKDKATAYENLGNGEGNPKAAAILLAADNVIDLFKSAQWQKLYEEMSPAVRDRVSEPQMAAQCETLIERFGILTDSEIFEIHCAEFATLPKNSPPGGMTGVQGHSNVLPNPIYVASPVSGRGAVVLGRIRGSRAGLKGWLTLVLEATGGRWRLAAFHLSPCEAGGHGGAWFWQRAEQFEAEGKHRNAFLYRGFGAQLLMPGPFLGVPVASQRVEDSLKGQAPSNLPFPDFRPAEQWQMEDGTKLAVDCMAIASAPTFISLEVRYKSERGDLESTAARQEREKLFRYICAHFPEYREAFDGVFVGSLTSWGKGYRDYFPFEREPGKSGPDTNSQSK